VDKKEQTPSPLTGKIEWKGSALLGPVPAVMVTCGPVNAPDIITVSWTGICCTRPPMTYISVRPERFSHHLLCEGGCFVINLVPASMAGICDWCGTYTGAKADKFARMGLTAVPSQTVDTVMIAECPVSVSCRVRQVLPLGSHDLFLAEIVGISVAPGLLDDAGKLHMERADLLCSMHGAYYAPDRWLADLGCSTKVRAEDLRLRPETEESRPAPGKGQKNSAAANEKRHYRGKTSPSGRRYPDRKPDNAPKNGKSADGRNAGNGGQNTARDDRKGSSGKGDSFRIDHGADIVKGGENTAQSDRKNGTDGGNGFRDDRRQYTGDSQKNPSAVMPTRPGRKAGIRRRKPVVPPQKSEKNAPHAGKNGFSAAEKDKKDKKKPHSN